MNGHLCRLTLCVTAALGVSFAVPAKAQEKGATAGSANSATDSGNELPAVGEVIVTARRVEERAQDVPISITVFNQQQLADRNVVNSQDLAAYTPSLSANNNFGNQNSSFAIRGFVQDIGTQPSVGVYFADVVAPRGASNNIPIGDGAGPGTFFDLQNVQVLKGPQGTLFGRNTTGGAILIVPQKPTATPGGYIEAAYGNFDMKRIQAVGNLPLNDNVRVRIGVDHQSRDGYLNNDSGVGPSRLGDIGYTAVRASLVVDITPELENYTIASYSLSDTNGDVQKVVGCNPSTSPLNFIGQLACAQLAQEQAKGAGFYTVQNGGLRNSDTRLQTWQIIDTATWRASDDLTVKNIISYAQLQEKLRSAQFGTNFFLPGGIPVDFANSTPIPGGSTADESTTTEEIQVQGGALDGKLSYQSGVYAELVDPLATSGSQSPVFLNCTNSDTFQCSNPLGFGSINYTAGKTAFRNYGVYEQSTYKLTDVLKLTGGFRYTWDRVRSNSTLYTYQFPMTNVAVPTCTNPDTSLPGCAVRYRESSSAPTGLVDLDYTPNQDVLVYAKYSRGYRAGGIIPAAPTAFSTFQPEHVDTYESGIKTTFREVVKGTFDLSIFYNDFSNQQLQLNLNPKPLTAVSPSSAILNAGKSRIYGAEVEASITPIDNFTLDASYTYLNTRIQQVTVPQSAANSPYVVASPIMVGDSLTLSPKNKLALTGTYTLPMPGTIGRVAVGATFTHTGATISNYVDRTFAAPINALGTLPALNLLNLNLDWSSIAGSPVDLGVFATNVTDRKYFTYVPGLFGTTGFETASLGQPRFYGARIRWWLGK